MHDCAKLAVECLVSILPAAKPSVCSCFDNVRSGQLVHVHLRSNSDYNFGIVLLLLYEVSNGDEETRGCRYAKVSSSRHITLGSNAVAK